MSLETDSPDTPPIPVAAAVLVRGGRFLLALRPARKRQGGLWEFPGGKIEEGESLPEGLARELREELGLRVTSVGSRLFMAGEDGSAFVIEFVAVEAEGAPVANEHDAIGWFSLQEACSLPLAPADEAFVRHLTEARTDD